MRTNKIRTEYDKGVAIEIAYRNQIDKDVAKVKSHEMYAGYLEGEIEEEREASVVPPVREGSYDAGSLYAKAKAP